MTAAFPAFSLQLSIKPSDDLGRDNDSTHLQHEHSLQIQPRWAGSTRLRTWAGLGTCFRGQGTWRSTHRMESEQEINTGPDSTDGVALLPWLTPVTSWCLLLPLWLQEIQQDNPALMCNFHVPWKENPLSPVTVRGEKQGQDSYYLEVMFYKQDVSIQTAPDLMTHYHTQQH